MRKIRAEILENKKITPQHCKIRIKSDYLAKNIRPGQFIEIRCSSGTDPLLRRPLSVHRISRSWIEVLFEMVGKGTEALSLKAPGDELDIIGPLGYGFKSPPGGRQSIIVAGGIGVAPLMALADKLAYSVKRITYREKQNIHVFIGAKTSLHILCAKEFKKLGCKVLVATEDGSIGRKGLITDILKIELDAKSSTLNAIIYACGPTGMLKAVSVIARQRHMTCQVSLEERMACGLGVCLGCPVKVRTDLVDNEYKMVCKDGPVFDSERIIW